MECLNSVLWCFIPGLLAKRRKEREERTQMELLKQKSEQLCQVKVSRNYGERKNKILDGIAFDHSRTVVVWPQDGHEVSRSDVVEQLKKYGEPLYFQDRWALDEDACRVWSGALFVFKKAEDAERVSLDFPLKIKYLRSTLLGSVVDVLVDCELLHPDCKGQTSKVVIRRGEAPLRPEDVDGLHEALSSFGSLQTFFVHNGPTTLGWYCEATYPYLTQAYMAAVMTDGLADVGDVYTTTVDTSTPRDEQILADARECAVQLANICFPK